MSGTNYKHLGNYIRPVDVRNKELKVTSPMGVNIGKFFMPSVANTIGTDLSKYKLVAQWQFACNLMHVGRDEALPIACNENKKDMLVSPAYHVFEIIDTNVLMPEFLTLLFKRREFDREAWFYTDGDVRQGLPISSLYNMKLPVPSIEEQKRIVAQYQAVEKRIRNNERLIASLEDTAQSIFRHRFVDNIDLNNLPEGWKMGNIDDLATISSGKSLSDKIDFPNNEYKYPVAGASGIIGYARTYNYDCRFLTIGRVGTIGIVNKYLDKAWAADNVLVFMSNYYDYTYQVLKSLNYDEITKGGVQSLITQGEIKKCELIIPSESEIIQYERTVSYLSSYIQNLKEENKLNSELLLTLLDKLV